MVIFTLCTVVPRFLLCASGKRFCGLYMLIAISLEGIAACRAKDRAAQRCCPHVVQSLCRSLFRSEYLTIFFPNVYKC